MCKAHLITSSVFFLKTFLADDDRAKISEVSRSVNNHHLVSIENLQILRIFLANCCLEFCSLP